MEEYTGKKRPTPAAPAAPAPQPAAPPLTDEQLDERMRCARIQSVPMLLFFFAMGCVLVWMYVRSRSVVLLIFAVGVVLLFASSLFLLVRELKKLSRMKEEQRR